MLRRLVVLVGVMSLALAAAAPALALSVHVRVEGLNTTVYGGAEPSLTPFSGTLVADDGSRHALAGPTALGALEAASRAGEFYYRLRAASFGLYVDRIGRYPAAATSGWVYKVNGVSPPVGAADYVLAEGDRVLWYFARFGRSGGPPTLALARRGGCYRARAQDDTGRSRQVRDVVFRLDERRVRARSGVLCPGGHWHTLRATKPGFVRSELVRAR